MSYTGKAIDLSKYDKYDKQVELTKVEVELGLIQDLDKMWRDAQKDTEKARAMGRELKGIYQKMVKDLSDTNKEISKAYSKFKELGLKDTSELDDVAKKVARDLRGIDEYAKAIARLG